MNTINANKMTIAENIVGQLTNTNVKVIKKDKGLLERENNEGKVILVEDNRQVLFG